MELVDALNAENKPLSCSASATDFSTDPDQDSLESVHPDGLADVHRLFADALKSPLANGSQDLTGYDVEMGNVVWSEEFIVNRFDDADVRGMVINWRDATNTRETREPGPGVSQRWQRTVTESPSAVITVDTDGRVLSWNAGAEHLFGWPAETALGRVLCWVPPEERPNSLEVLRRVGKTGHTETFEARRITGDSRPSWVLGSVARLPKSGPNDVPELILTYTDLSLHVQLEQQSKTLALLEERERIAMQLHDGVIQSLYGVCLNLGSGAPDKRAEYARLINQATAQIHKIIQDVRNYIFDLRPDQLQEHTLEEGLQLLAEEMRINGLLRVDLELPNEAMPLSRRVTVELLHIAREATSNVIRHAQAAAAELILEQADNLVTLSIRDHGRGFDTTERRLLRGNGIGSMRVRARSIGGATHLVSTAGKGTVVQIEVPISDSGDELHEPRAVRLLVVDDHKLVRLGLIQAFKSAPSLEVIGEAAGVDEAVDLARRMQPDVVLMDVRLAGGSGIDACRLIRSERPATQVIMLTSFSDEEAVVDSVLAGAAGYLLKQNSPEQLVSSIERVAAGETLLDPSAVHSAKTQARRFGSGLDSLSRLSGQEERVLHLMAEGKTNREIADALGLSEHTVRTYTSNIFGKLHVKRRAEAAALAARRPSGLKS